MQAVIFAQFLGSARPGARDGRKSALCGPWRRFLGSAAPIPYPRHLSRLLRVPVRPGRIAWRSSSSDVAMLASSIAWRPFFLGVQPCGLPARAGVRVERRRSACLFFTAKPLLTAFQRARCWMWAQAVELAPARRAAPGRCLAAGQPFDRPTRSGGAKGAKRPEGRRARRALRWFGSRCRSVFSTDLACQLQASIYRKNLKA